MKKRDWLYPLISLIVMLLPYDALAKSMSESVDVPLQYTETKEKEPHTCDGLGMIEKINCVAELIDGAGAGTVTSTADLELNITPYMLSPGFERVEKIDNLSQDITVYLELRGKGGGLLKTNEYEKPSFSGEFDGDVKRQVNGESKSVQTKLHKWKKRLKLSEIETLYRTGELSMQVIPPFSSLQKLKLKQAPVAVVVRVPLKKNCTMKDLAGNFAEPLCTVECTKKFRRWSYFLTQYHIDSSLYQGTHQGVWIYSAEYLYDPRFLAKDGVVKQEWKDDSEPVLSIVKDPKHEEVSRQALCGFNEKKNVINNHGRTLALKYADGEEGVSPVNRMATFTIGPLEHKDWSDPENNNTSRGDDFGQCVDEKQIPDGYCESVCGNCSYVLPPVDEDASRVAIIQKDNTAGTFLPWNKTLSAYTRNEGGANIFYTEQNEFQYGMGGSSYNVINNFTHCVNLNATSARQYIVQVPPPGLESVVTGRYGHNSNTDAEAELAQFRACIGNPKVKASASCAICGVNRRVVGDKAEQWPCINNTNEAKRTFWESEQYEKVDDNSLGKYRDEAPVCHIDGKKVFGM